MAVYAYLEADLRCSRCGSPIIDLLWFEWGLCVSPSLADREMYHIGDAIRWRSCADGATPAWASFPNGDRNVGDSAIRHLIALDVINFPVLSTLREGRCVTCGNDIAGAAIEIREGVIARAWLYPSGEFPDGVDHYRAAEDGSMEPMRDWTEHTTPFVDCPSRLSLIVKACQRLFSR